ncbi:MAG: ribonuclease Z [Desulfobacca sp.]|nr:ribonuclease Z [Desulfobacca sp.]
MNPMFHPHLVNGPLGDPAVYIDMKFAKRAILFDMGEIRSLSSRKILRVSHVFISHTHLDHFVGFDHLLRICLGRDKVIHLFGPPNFLDQLRHKLSAYTWNLVENYPYSLDLIVREVHPDHMITARLSSSTAFKIEFNKEVTSFNGLLHEEASFLVRAVFLDHKIPCLAFVLEERSHLNILKIELEKMGLTKGPWLRQLKEAIWRGEKDSTMIRASGLENGEGKERPLSLETLRKFLIRITPGQKIGYVTDTIYTVKTQEAIKKLVTGSDYLFIETAFLEEDVQRANEKYHLTARQAGMLAGEAGVKRMIPFHVSPKYSSNPALVIQEAQLAFITPSEKKNLSINA